MSNVAVTWFDPNTYKTQPATKQKVETDVKNSSVTTNASTRGATSAIIKGGIHKSKPPKDQRDHVTVEYKKPDGTHVTTKHIVTTP